MTTEPTREEICAWLTEACGRGIPMFDEAATLADALHGLAYIQRQIHATNTYKPNIGQTTAATSSIQWMLDYFARQALSPCRSPEILAEIARLNQQEGVLPSRLNGEVG